MNKKVIIKKAEEFDIPLRGNETQKTLNQIYKILTKDVELIDFDDIEEITTYKDKDKNIIALYDCRLKIIYLRRMKIEIENTIKKNDFIGALFLFISYKSYVDLFYLDMIVYHEYVTDMLETEKEINENTRSIIKYFDEWSNCFKGNIEKLFEFSRENKDKYIKYIINMTKKFQNNKLIKLKKRKLNPKYQEIELL